MWDDRTGTLLWVDITAGLVHRWAPGTTETEVRRFDAEIGAVVPTQGGQALVLAAGHELLLVDGTGAIQLAGLAERDPDIRFNDCRCDPRGRLYAGTLSKQRRPGAAALHRLEEDGSLVALWPATISNGIGWSPEGSLMYYVDSTTQRIDVLDYDLEHGRPSERRPWVVVDPSDGLPDGLTVDSEGGVWLCLFGGGRVRRYAPDGTLDLEISLPVTNPTCPVLGGEDRRTLYVTTARHRLDDARLATEPLAGALLELRSPVAGLPVSRFRPPGDHEAGHQLNDRRPTPPSG